MKKSGLFKRSLVTATVAPIFLIACALPEKYSRLGSGRNVCTPQDSNLCFNVLPALLESADNGMFHLRDELRFVDVKGQTWSAPSNTITDGASIPAIFVPLIGTRMSLRWREAAILHDAYCAEANENLPQYQSADWETVHQMFYDAVLALGTSPTKALIMYAAIYLGGPRWEDPKRSLDQVSDEQLQGVMQRCLDWIEENDPDPEKLRKWMQDREAELLQAI